MDAKDKILSMTEDGLSVFRYYIDPGLQPKKKIRNPFYSDHNAGCHVSLDPKTHKYYLYDFGDPDYKGDCFWFVAELKGLNVKSDFRQVLQIIVRDLNLPINLDDRGGNNNRKSMRFVASPPPISKSFKARKDSNKEYDYSVNPWTETTLQYWFKYGITLDVLDKYGVVSLASFTATGTNGKYTINSSLLSPMFAYAGKRYMKLYRPYADTRFQWAGEKPSTYVFGYQQLPQLGDLVIITGGEKDVLTLASHGFNAICFNSETATIPSSIIDVLSLRFRYVVVMYDCDETGVKAMAKAADDLSQYGIITIELPLSGSKTDKDVSDFFAAGKTAEDLHAILTEALDELDPEADMMVDACELDFDNPPEKSKVVVAVEGVPIGSYDNLMCVTGGSGTGKNNFVSALIAGTLKTDDNSDIDTLGFEVTPNLSGKAVLLFDTEQSDYQLYNNAKRSMIRVGIGKKPRYLHAFYITIHNRRNRIRVIRKAIDKYHHKHGGVHFVVIDGVADLVKSANDESECIAVIDELHRMAGQYHTCILCVLHYVPNGMKLRGHIGSELQRKASGILAVEKESEHDEFSTIKATKVRDGNPLEAPILMMVWDKIKKMFVSAGKKTEEEKAQRRNIDLQSMALDLYEDKNAYTYTELCKAIVETFDVAERTAKDYVSQMYGCRYIIKNGKKYVLGVKKTEKTDSDETN